MTGASGAVSRRVPLWWRATVVVLSLWAGWWFLRQQMSWPTAGLDGRVYRDAAQAFLDRSEIYAGRFQGLPFTYPPFALVLFVPLALVASNVAALAMFLGSVAALIAVVRWCLHYGRLGSPGSWWTTVGIAAAASVLFEPARTTLGLGQVNLMLLALILGVDARATRWSGAGAGFAAAVKITPSLLVVAQLVRGDLRAFGRGVLAFVVATGIAAALAPQATRTYFTSLLWDSNRPGGIAYQQNQSLRGLFARHLPDHAQAAWAVSALLVLLVGMWAVRRHRADPFYALTAAAMTGLLVSPVSWSHHWVWIMPCAAIGLRAGRRTPIAAASALLLVTTVAELLFWTTGGAPVVTQEMYVVAGLLWLVAAATSGEASRPGLGAPDAEAATSELGRSARPAVSG